MGRCGGLGDGRACYFSLVAMRKVLPPPVPPCSYLHEKCGVLAGGHRPLAQQLQLQRVRKVSHPALGLAGDCVFGVLADARDVRHTLASGELRGAGGS